MIKGLAWAAVGLALAAGPAAAKPIADGGVSAEEARAWLQAQGYKADAEVEKDGDPFVRSAAEGLNFTVYFYDCKGGKRCAAVQFYVGFEQGPDTPKLDAINAWNRDNRYVRAYIDKDGGVAFEYDANVSPGGSWEALQDDFDTFLSRLPEIKTFVKW